MPAQGVVLHLKLYPASTETEAASWSSSPLEISHGAEVTERAVFSTMELPHGGLLAGLTALVNGTEHILATGRVDIAESFLRGYANGDGQLDISDPVSVFGYLFLGGEEPSCHDAADFNDDGALDISDGIYGLSFLFLGGAAIPMPGSEACGRDPTADALKECSYDGHRCP